MWLGLFVRLFGILLLNLEKLVIKRLDEWQVL
jgi:hypothetical protein